MFRVLQSVADYYYKVSQTLKKFSSTTKCDRLLSQSVSGITKSDTYCKVRNNKSRIFLMKFEYWLTKLSPKFVFFMVTKAMTGLL